MAFNQSPMLMYMSTATTYAIWWHKDDKQTYFIIRRWFLRLKALGQHHSIIRLTTPPKSTWAFINRYNDSPLHSEVQGSHETVDEVFLRQDQPKTDWCAWDPLAPHPNSLGRGTCVGRSRLPSGEDHLPFCPCAWEGERRHRHWPPEVQIALGKKWVRLVYWNNGSVALV